MIGASLPALLDDLRAACDLAEEVWPHETARVALIPESRRRWSATVVRGEGDLIETESYGHPGEALSDLCEQMREILRKRDADSAEDDEADRAYEKWKATREFAAE